MSEREGQYVNSALQTLIKLQDVDQVILGIQQKIDAFPKILQQLDVRLHATQEDVLKLQESIEEQEKLRRSKERDIEMKNEQIKKYQGQLLQVKTNKEYSALLVEIKGLKAKNSLTEDDILELMESIERAKTALVASKEEQAKAEARIEQEKQAQKAERKHMQHDLEQEQTKRDDLAGTVEANLIREYTKLLQLRNGVAVARVDDNGVCAGCYVALTPQMFAEIKTGKYLHRCPTCSRFLYWNNQHPAEENE